MTTSTPGRDSIGCSPRSAASLVVATTRGAALAKAACEMTADVQAASVQAASVQTASVQTASVQTERVQPERVQIARKGCFLLRARDANTFFRRLRGLHGSLPLGPDEALIIRPCNAIQTWRMSVAIDVLFLNADGVVLKGLTVRPGRWEYCRGAHAVIEMAEGAITRLELATGDVLTTSTGSWT